MEIEHRLAIARPSADVFARIADWSSHGEWISGLHSTEVLTPDPGVGQRFRQELERGPLRIELEGLVTAWEEPSRIDFEATARDVRLECEFRLSGAGSGTELLQRTTIRLESFVLKMMASKIKDELGRKQQTDLGQLKALLESTPG